MIDQAKVREAVTMFLTAIGEDPNRAGLVETPDRIARMCAELFGGLTQTAAEPLAKRFPVDENNLVMEKDITFYSVCEHHLLPFYGKVHIAHCLNEAAAQQLREIILREHPGCAVTIGDCTGLCSFYAEKGGLIVGYEGA